MSLWGTFYFIHMYPMVISIYILNLWFLKLLLNARTTPVSHLLFCIFLPFSTGHSLSLCPASFMMTLSSTTCWEPHSNFLLAEDALIGLNVKRENLAHVHYYQRTGFVLFSALWLGSKPLHRYSELWNTEHWYKQRGHWLYHHTALIGV